MEQIILALADELVKSRGRYDHISTTHQCNRCRTRHGDKEKRIHLLFYKEGENLDGGGSIALLKVAMQNNYYQKYEFHRHQSLC